MQTLRLIITGIWFQSSWSAWASSCTFYGCGCSHSICHPSPNVPNWVKVGWTGWKGHYIHIVVVEEILYYPSSVEMCDVLLECQWIIGMLVPGNQTILHHNWGPKIVVDGSPNHDTAATKLIMLDDTIGERMVINYIINTPFPFYQHKTIWTLTSH